jgi:hypothetical protein
MHVSLGYIPDTTVVHIFTLEMGLLGSTPSKVKEHLIWICPVYVPSSGNSQA